MPEEVQEPVETPTSTEAEEVSNEEPVDIVSLISEGEEEVKPVLDKKDKAIIKFKQQGKEARKENEQLKARLDELEKKMSDRELAKPDPSTYEGGAEDDRYTEDLEKFISTKAKLSMEDEIAKRLKEERAARDEEEYIERHELVIRESQEKANGLIIEHIKNKPDVKAIIESNDFMENLAKIPLSITRKIVTSPDVGIIFEYYARNPQRFANLANNNPDEAINLGVKMGQIKSLKKKTEPNVIKPLQGGDNTAKLDPIKDHDKYVLPDGTKDHFRWRRDMGLRSTK